MKTALAAMSMYEGMENEAEDAGNAEEKLMLRISMDRVRVGVVLNPGPRALR
jgi:hypothetical protein